MKFTDEIFSRSTIKGISNYLQCGQSEEEDIRSYETRIKEAYDLFEQRILKYDKKYRIF